MTYQIIYRKNVIRDEIPALSTSAKKLIKRAIEERLMCDPLHYGKPLRYALSGQRSLRVSTYRILYSVLQDTRTVTILHIGHRRDVYDE